MRIGKGKTWMLWAGLIGGVGSPSHASLGMDAVHPAFEITQVPLAAKYRTMGMAFLSDGRMVLLTTNVIGSGEIPDPSPDAAVYLIGGLNTAAPTATRIADMFRQPSGANGVNDKTFAS